MDTACHAEFFPKKAWNKTELPIVLLPLYNRALVFSTAVNVPGNAVAMPPRKEVVVNVSKKYPQSS